MTKYIVRVGCNVPDPTGKRDDKGRPVEVRLEAGDQITDTSVSPKDLKTLLDQKSIETALVETSFTASFDLEGAAHPPSPDSKAGKK